MWHEAVPSLPGTRRCVMIARDIMTRKVYTTCAEASVQEVAQLLSRKNISGVPVIDKDGKMIGIVTEADIIGKVDREGLRAADIMSPEIIAVDEIRPTFGGFCLSSIASPRCFTVADHLARAVNIPVLHAKQDATAAAILGGLYNALKLVGK